MGARTRGFANNVLTSGKLDATDGLTGNLASTNFANATVTNIEELPPAVGSTISSVASNPAAPVAEGKIWYNTSTDSFNIAPVLEAWSSGAPLITDRRLLAGAGTQTAALAVGGYGPAATTSETEEYNGSGWSTGGSLGTARYRLASAGTQTAGLAFGGELSAIKRNLTEEYNGSSWTAGGNLGTTRSLLAGAGIQTAGLAFGGYDTASTGATEEYDGSAWTAGGSLSSSRNALTGSGTQDSALAFGGNNPPITNATEEYNGTAWTSGGSLNTARSYLAGCGTQTSTLGFGGGPSGPGGPRVGATEFYDGSTWTTSPASLATARDQLAGSGTTSAGLAFGGREPSTSRATEEYNKSINVITVAAWASGGNLSTGRYELGTVGTQTAGLAFGGNRAVNAPTGIRTETEEYNGTSWTSGGALPAAKATQGFGVQTAAVTVGGTVAPNPTAGSTTEEYNGTSWTSGNSLNTATVAMAASTGLESAGLRAGGGSDPVSRLSAVEEYDGTSWASVTSLPSTRFTFQGTGPQTAAFFTGGNTAPPTQETTDSLDYNGSTWTAGPTMVFGMRLHGVSGNSNTSNLSFGGEPTIPGRSSTQSFDGTGFVTAPSLGTGRSDLGGCGTASASLAVGGNNAPSYDLVNTEEFTGETSALNVESLTTS